MDDFEEIKKYLPKYLSPEANESLFTELKAFTEKPHDRLYSSKFYDEEQVLQGDGLPNLWIGDLPSNTVMEGPAMVLSNTCEIDTNNEKSLPPRVSYCPILLLSRFIDVLKSHGVDENVISETVDAIKKQRILSILYLPKGERLPEDCIAMLGQPNNCDLRAVPPVKEQSNRLFSLSNFGWYLFLFKLSLHSTRIQEAIDRG